MTSRLSAPARTLLKALALLIALALGGWLLFDRPVTAEDSGDAGDSTQSASMQKLSLPSEADPGAVVATIGSTKITQAELEQQLAAQLVSVRLERHKILEDGLDNYLGQQVLQKEADARGVSTTALLKSEVSDKVADPTDDEIDAFYESNKSRLRQPKEQMVDRIRQYLRQQKYNKAYSDYMDSLKSKYDVQVFLKPMRLDVDSPDAPSEGPANAPVTLVEFSDFQCPFCARVNPTIEKAMKEYDGKIRLVYRQFPLTNIHPNALRAAEASLCARDQGKFWAMHDAMFADQRGLSADGLKATAVKLGLKANQFNECLDSKKYQDDVLAERLAGVAAGVKGTPALFVNGRPLSGGAVAYETLSQAIDEELARVQGGSDASGS
jgi:protein-disulfide isomerase